MVIPTDRGFSPCFVAAPIQQAGHSSSVSARVASREARAQPWTGWSSTPLFLGVAWLGWPARQPGHLHLIVPFFLLAPRVVRENTWTVQNVPAARKLQTLSLCVLALV